jgi:hypothetical protein
MRALLAALGVLLLGGCTHWQSGKESTFTALIGVYEGREVIDTEERLTLRQDRSFTYDFIPFGRDGGASYNGRWKIEHGDLVLVAPLEAGQSEEFWLSISFERDAPVLTYTWAAYQRQRATMLIPNVFARSTEGLNQSLETTRGK